MTYEDFRKYGYISKLSKITNGGGPSQSTLNTQNSLTSQQLELAKESQASADQDRSQRLELQQPLIDREKALAGGDRTKALEASMPAISKISAGYDSAKANIMNSLPPGPARDRAMADLEVSKATGMGTAQATAVSSAPEILANVGSGIGAFSLQELGAALSGFSGASNSNQASGSLQSQQAAAKWQPITALAGVAGSTAGSLFGGKK